jgi:pimeloyl-ACP methyl ester carboxylesterase
MAMKSGLFNVRGAQLYHEVRGTGPGLLLIPGAGGDAGYFSGLAEALSNSFTVITYDRRGNSRSSRVEEPMSVAQQAADAKALIDGLAGGAAYVFGNSGGAIIALELASRYPEALRGVVAHEPPAMNILPPGDPDRNWFGDHHKIYAESGAMVAAGEFVKSIRGEGTYAWPDDLQQRFLGNLEFLYRWEWDGWAGFQPDIAALSKVEFPLVLAAGAADRGVMYARPSIEIAAHARLPWVEFPGIHLEFLARPELFAAALRAVVSGMHSQSSGVPDGWRTM